MKLVTAAEMRRIDEITIRERGVPGFTLMTRAGEAVARETLERFDPDSVAILAGKGNNGGDGFVVARVLAEAGVRVEVLTLFDPAEAKGDARRAFEALGYGIPVHRIEAAAGLGERLREFDVVVDAMLGTGLAGPARGLVAEVIEILNATPMNVVAVDVPSGLIADGAGEAAEAPCVRAQMTVTVGLPKLGLIVGAQARRAGIITVADIEFPRDLLERDALTVNLLTEEAMAAALPARDPAGHKGTFGRVAILGGSEGMTGAAVLAARAAVRSGAGLIYAVYPQALGGTMEAALAEPVKLPLAGEERWFSGEMIEAALEALAEADADAVALGPGVGQRETTGAFVSAMTKRIQAPLVIDADGLNLLANDLEPLRRREGATVLTPHPAEAARLLGTTTAAVQEDRLGACVELARELGATVLLKGAQTVVTAPDGQRYVNPTGNSGLAKGGSGDVLTGLIAGLLGQGMAATAAAALGAFVHGMAADLAAEKGSVRSITPSDVIECFGAAFARLEKLKREIRQGKS
jgi:ADP-dependent NAD(P)H-hydrate dehydratase / NAD(P)H-hydrate epimerase